jgi:hypothetical protein
MKKTIVRLLIVFACIAASWLPPSVQAQKPIGEIIVADPRPIDAHVLSIDEAKMKEPRLAGLAAMWGCLWY